VATTEVKIHGDVLADQVTLEKIGAMIADVSSDPSTRAIGMRLVVNLIAVANACAEGAVTSGSNSDQSLLQAFLLHVCLLEYLPINYRAQKIAAPKDDCTAEDCHVATVSNFVGKLFPYLTSAMMAVRTKLFSTRDSEAALAVNLSDVIDVSLMERIVQYSDGHTTIAELVGKSSGVLDEESTAALVAAIQWTWEKCGLPAAGMASIAKCTSCGASPTPTAVAMFGTGGTISEMKSDFTDRVRLTMLCIYIGIFPDFNIVCQVQTF